MQHPPVIDEARLDHKIHLTRTHQTFKRAGAGRRPERIIVPASTWECQELGQTTPSRSFASFTCMKSVAEARTGLGEPPYEAAVPVEEHKNQDSGWTRLDKAV